MHNVVLLLVVIHSGLVFLDFWTSSAPQAWLIKGPWKVWELRWNESNGPGFVHNRRNVESLCCLVSKKSLSFDQWQWLWLAYQVQHGISKAKQCQMFWQIGPHSLAVSSVKLNVINQNVSHSVLKKAADQIASKRTTVYVGWCLKYADLPEQGSVIWCMWN